MLSEKCNAFFRPLKNKLFKEERVTRAGLDSLSKSATLESNKGLCKIKLSQLTWYPPDNHLLEVPTWN